jgi:hypothetical protein
VFATIIIFYPSLLICEKAWKCNYQNGKESTVNKSLGGSTYPS